jgi:mannose-1-phosphate guanylyltransferase
MATQLWTVILAAGSGRRLSSVTGEVPKQFWRGAHGRSLLEDTVSRFLPLAPSSRTVVVIDAAHRDHVSRGGVPTSVGTTIVQPEDRGTAVGVLLALMPVLDADPGAIVALTPSDHGVVDDARFRHGVLEAAREARSCGTVVLFGVQPAIAHDDYGWITPGPSRSSSSLRSVAAFVEKPAQDDAARLLSSGAVWNTMVLVARARAIRDLYSEFLPEVAGAFAAASRLPPSERDAFFADLYPRLPRFDFSRDVLSAAPNLATYIWPSSVGWSDLGTPERLRAWQQRSVTLRREQRGAIAS